MGLTAFKALHLGQKTTVFREVLFDANRSIKIKGIVGFALLAQSWIASIELTVVNDLF